MLEECLGLTHALLLSYHISADATAVDTFQMILITFALNNEFEITADETVNLLLPYFTNSSTFIDFNKTMNFVMALKEFPIYFCLFMPLALNSDLSAGLDYADFLCNQKLWNTYDDDNWRTLYNWSKTTSEFPDNYREIFNKAVLQPPTCLISNKCYLTRFNIIIVSNTDDFSWIIDHNTETFYTYFYFAFISTSETWREKDVILNSSVNSVVKCYNVDYIVPSNTIKDEIFATSSLYTVDYTQNAYNFFIIAKESELLDHISIASYLHAYANEKKWDANSSSVYFALIEKQDKSLYESGIVVRDKLNVKAINASLLAVSTKVETKSKIPSIAKYLKEALTTPFNSNSNATYQWNVLITSDVPMWIKELIDDENDMQPNKMLDIYIYSNNNTVRYNQIENQTKAYYETHSTSKKSQEIHLSIVKTAAMCDDEKSYWPTGRVNVPQKYFNFRQISKKRVQWYFILIFIILIISAAAALIAFLIWRRRVNRMLELKFAWALQGGFAPKEIEETVEKWKKMFIDEKFVEVCFDKIRGRGSSSIIYEAVLHTQSPLFITSKIMNGGIMTKKQAEKNNKNNEKVVIKIVNKFGHDDFEQVLREVNAALKIGIHKHVCCLLGWSLYLTTHALIYECVDGYDLHTWLKLYANALGLITEMQIAKILWQISDGMEHISAVGIVHRDLAARNILLTKTLEVKITDFGLASICNKQFIYQAQINRRLPIRWMAPESLCSRLFSEASDIWSFGVLIWEVFTFGAVPYDTMEEGKDIADYISRGKTLVLPYKTGQIWQILTRDCWKLNRDERPNFKAVRNLIGQFLEEKTINYGYLRCKSE